MFWLFIRLIYVLKLNTLLWLKHKSIGNQRLLINYVLHSESMTYCLWAMHKMSELQTQMLFGRSLHNISSNPKLPAIRFFFFQEARLWLVNVHIAKVPNNRRKGDQIFFWCELVRGNLEYYIHDTTGNALARVQRVHKPADLWDIGFCTRWFWGF